MCVSLCVAPPFFRSSSLVSCQLECAIQYLRDRNGDNEDFEPVLGIVAEDELEALYARASVFVFLSEYEGFGLTPLEALSHGSI